MHVLGQGLAIESEIDVNIFFFLVCGVLVDICFACFVFACIFKQKTVLYKEKTLNVC